jgi:mono/diheme cytochrome c family protein
MHKLLRFLMAGVFLAGCCLSAQDLPVTDVEGESWLNHLARDFTETSMGKTGRLGPSADEPGDYTPRPESRPLMVVPTQQSVTLHGSDLYRLNCQGCHGESGLGAPPEINSVINPVRATSTALVMERMTKVGMDVSPANAAEMAQQSRTALLLRIHKGGENMPPFPHLSEPEIGALLAYLKQLAGFPGAQREQLTLTESRLRVGEHIAKSTCHICHAATGANPSPEQLLEGAIPPLSTLTARKDLSEFVRKVTHGAPVLMGEPPLSYRGRMPVFGYLSEDEAADVYLYLTLDPPQASAAVSAAITNNEPLPPSGPTYNSHMPVAGSQGNFQQISLVRFAFFPAVLFLVLGGVVVKCLPLAVKTHSGLENACNPCATSSDGQNSSAPHGFGGKLLRSAHRDAPDQKMLLVLHPPRH